MKHGHPITTDRPFIPYLKAVTVSPVLFHTLVNNTPSHKHEIREANYHYFANGSTFVCSICKREIVAGEIGAKDQYRGDYPYCFDCVKPLGNFKPEDVKVISFTYKLKRRSRRFPKGKVTWIEVFTDATFAEYSAGMAEAGYPIVEHSVVALADIKKN